MNSELFIARRVFSEQKHNKKGISRPIVSIAIIGIALGLAVMLLSVSIVTGFKREITRKIIGFGAHIQLTHYSSNYSYETEPIRLEPNIRNDIENHTNITHIQSYAQKAGIIKTRDNIQGVVLKGINTDFDPSFLKETLKEGQILEVSDTSRSDGIIISRHIASLLKLKLGDHTRIYFIEERPRARRFAIKGIYETSLADFDEKFAFVDIKHIQKLNAWEEDQYSGLEVFLEDFSALDQTTRDLREITALHHQPGTDRLKVESIKEKYVQIFDWLNLTDINVWIILFIIIAVAGFNMVSGLLILILERTNMIGLLKSIGTTNRSIRKIFLYQSAFLISKGLLWGNIIGIVIIIIQGTTHIIKLDPSSYYLDAVPVTFNLLHILLLNLGALGAIILMLILPSYIIARISPAKTIKFN